MLLFSTPYFVTAVLLCLPSATAYAGSWQAAASAPMTVEYDSNPLLAADSNKAVTRSVIAPDYSLVGTFGRDELRFGLGLNLQRSSDSSIVLDREDPDLQLGWQRENELGGFGFTAKYVESSTLSNTLANTEVITTDSTQKKYSLGANWSISLSERSTLANDTEYTYVSYDIDSLTGYNNLSSSLSWNYAWTERIEPFTRFSISRYEPRDAQDNPVSVSSNSYSPAVGLKLAFSERLEGSFNLGVNQVSGSASGPSGQGGFDVHYVGERFDARINVARSTVVSGEGGNVEVSTAGGTWSYAVSETDRLGVDASWQDSQGQTPNTLQQLSIWASRELSPFWNTRLSIMHKQRQQDNVADAHANILGVSLVYSHPDF